jgi:hypothetical protein
MKIRNPQCENDISVNQSEISNSRLSLSTITDRAALQFSRSAFPNLILATFAASKEWVGKQVPPPTTDLLD